MKTFEQKKRDALAITDPREACIKIWTDKELTLTEMEQIEMEYQAKYGVGMEEMCFYPNGERVLKAEMFWEREK